MEIVAVTGDGGAIVNLASTRAFMSEAGTAACLFPADSAGFMTGQTILVDGGLRVKMIHEE